jgi:hypothetical protein
MAAPQAPQPQAPAKAWLEKAMICLHDHGYLDANHLVQVPDVNTIFVVRVFLHHALATNIWMDYNDKQGAKKKKLQAGVRYVGRAGSRLQDAPD